MRDLIKRDVKVTSHLSEKKSRNDFAELLQKLLYMKKGKKQYI